MKQVVKKSLGAAALGAAMVAAGAGAASAAPTDALGPAADTATGAVDSLPVQGATDQLPGGLTDSLGSVQDAVGGILNPEGADATKQLASGGAGEEASAPGGGMLGGLPIGGLGG